MTDFRHPALTLPGGPLRADDYAMLAKSAIPRELADEALLRHLAHLDAKIMYQRKHGNCEGVLFPNIFPTEPDKLRPSRLRLSEPQNNSKLRYLAEIEGGNRFYICPGTPVQALTDIDLPIWLTEGERKTLSLLVLSRHGAETPRSLCIGLSGVYAWLDRREKTATANGERVAADSTPVADFGHIAWAGRVVIIIFDKNILTNRQVRMARESLKQQLIGRGALVEYVDLPQIEEINGIDDLHCLWGPDKTLEFIEQARKRKASAWGAFQVRDNGVYFIDSHPEKDPTLICGRLDITAATRDAQSLNWGRLLEWMDNDGRLHRWAMPIGLLSGAGDEYRRRLLDGGLYVGIGAKAREKLALYLQTQCPATRVTCIDRIGWHNGCFVMPDDSIRARGAERIIYQSDAESDHRLEVRGTVNQWREHVGQMCSSNSRLVLAVSCAFAGPLLELSGIDSGGIHIVGQSSEGKSTALVVAGSVLGGGPSGYADTWRATANGLEAVAEAHNDLTLILDELGQIDPKEASDVAYLLANGAGKVRMTKAAGLRRRLGWRLLFLSSGEITLADHSASVGRRARGGAEVRLLNIPANAGKGMGLVEELHGATNAKAFVDGLKNAARRYYGAPIRAFIAHVIARRQEIIDELPGVRRYIVDRFAGASGEVLRAADRLAVIAAAGELATRWGLTGWQEGEARDAALTAMQEWITGRGSTGRSEDETAVHLVRRFIEAHGSSRFESAKLRLDNRSEPVSERIINRVGYREPGEDGEYWILPESWRTEVCAGIDYRTVCRALDEKGYLTREKPAWMRKARVHDHKATIWVFAVRASIMEGEP